MGRGQLARYARERDSHDRAAEAAGGVIRIEAAPMGMARRGDLPALTWVPTNDGFQDTRNILRELIGSALGA